MLLAAVAPRLQEAIVLQLACQLRRDRSAVAELGEIELLVRVGEPDRAPAAAVLPCTRGRGQSWANHAGRRNLVALQPQDRPEPLHVVLAEESVAALRPARRE